MNRILYCLFVCIAVLALPPASAWAVAYQVTVAGPLNGIISDINSSGVVVGTATLPSGMRSAFTWSASAGLTYLSPSSGYEQSGAVGINDDGLVVGSSWSLNSHQATLWDGSETAIGFGQFTPEGINAIGQVVGWTTSYDAVLWSESIGIEHIDSDARAYAVNDSGVVVGQQGHRGFVWTRDAGIDYIELAWPDMGTTAIAVNNSGQVVCQTYSGAVGGLAYLWQDGHDTICLGVLPGSDWSSATDMNNIGQVIGESGNYCPFIWDSTTGIQALPLPSGFSMVSACAINDSGVIVGHAYDGQGNQHMVLWEPVPEPSSLLALAAGLVPLAGLAIRRKK